MPFAYQPLPDPGGAGGPTSLLPAAPLQWKRLPNVGTRHPPLHSPALVPWHFCSFWESWICSVYFEWHLQAALGPKWMWALSGRFGGQRCSAVLISKLVQGCVAMPAGGETPPQMVPAHASAPELSQAITSGRVRAPVPVASHPRLADLSGLRSAFVKGLEGAQGSC